MPLRDELQPSRPGGLCSVKEWVDTQPDAAEWYELLDDASVQGSALFRLMRKYGFPNGDNPVQRHRRGGCICARSA